MAQVDWMYCSKLSAREKLSASKEKLTQARRVRVCRPSCWVISAGLMAFCHSRVSMRSWSIRDELTHRKILFVGKDEQERVTQLIFIQHALQLLAGLYDTVAIVAVDHEDDALCVLEVVPPQRTDLVLPTDVPHSKLNVLVLNRLDVEACMDRTDQ